MATSPVSATSSSSPSPCYRQAIEIDTPPSTTAKTTTNNNNNNNNNKTNITTTKITATTNTITNQISTEVIESNTTNLVEESGRGARGGLKGSSDSGVGSGGSIGSGSSDTMDSTSIVTTATAMTTVPPTAVSVTTTTTTTTATAAVTATPSTEDEQEQDAEIEIRERRKQQQKQHQQQQQQRTSSSSIHLTTTDCCNNAADGTADYNSKNEISKEDQQQHEKSQSNRSSIVDDIPEPIKVLDNIISEFEDTSKPPSMLGNGENQSEDDGYMSLSRKNMHKKDSEDASQSSINCVATTSETPNNVFGEYERLPNGDCPKEIVSNKNATGAEASPDHNILSTLPKARSSTSTSAPNYSSLPCCGVRSSSSESKVRGMSCSGERNVLGIDISAVHNAVLRGGLAKLPERIVNEHPITIYPGRRSPDGLRSNRPQRLSQSSVEKHREVCHILNPVASSPSASSSSTPSSTSSSAAAIGAIAVAGTSSSSVIKIRNILPMNNMPKKSTKDVRNKTKLRSASEYEFSDDSLEEQSLSPQATITSPLLSSSSMAAAQLTPNRQCGIAWEIQFERSRSKKTKATASAVKNHRQRTPIAMMTHRDREYNRSTQDYDDESESVLSATENSGTENWSSSAEKLNSCMYRHQNMLGKGTFIIRRSSKKEHPKVVDIFRTTSTATSSATSSRQASLDDHLGSPLEGDRNYMCYVNDNDPISLKHQQHLNAGVKPRYSLELEIANQCSPVTSPRDRLSLNIEPHHQNSSKKDSITKQKIGGKTSSEELAKLHKQAILKPNDPKHSADSLNEEPLSLDDDEGPNYEVYGYKSNTPNGLKHQEYTDLRTSNTTTPHTDLAPTLEEEEEQYSDFSYGCAPLKQIENNISALLRGEMAVRVLQPKRSLEFRPGVHKSESAKEMLLSQNAFGPLPPSPPSSNPDGFDYDDLPPLPPSPSEILAVNESHSLPKPPPPHTAASYLKTTSAEIHSHSSREELRLRDSKSALRHLNDELPPPPPPPMAATYEACVPPAVPPHRSAGGGAGVGGHSANTMKSWSIDSNYRKRSPKMLGYGSGITTPTGPQPPSGYDGPGSAGASYSTKRYVSYGTKRSLKQSPREEHRLQTSCSLPETPIFARGCDIPRTPFRRQNENSVSGSRTAPRSSTSHSINMGNSIVGIAGPYGTGMCQRQRSINHALASNEMLRLSGVPARGWYPKQRTMRPASTENIDRLTSARVWDSGTTGGNAHARKPLTLPPNLTPSFLNKSPREALRRVTSLLITKKKNTKERKNKPYSANTMEASNNSTFEMETNSSTAKNATTRSSNATLQKNQKKKGLFKNLWKRTKHVSLDQ